MGDRVIGVIGGSGVYAITGLKNAGWRTVDTPWGAPSDQILFGDSGGARMAFLPRHGRGHLYSPTDINYRANIDALKRSGVTDVISVSVCGSLREELAPGLFVIVDQFIDRTFAREKSFFGAGCVGHVALADPVCARLGDALEEAARTVGIDARRGGTYLAMEGPQFSTRAESRLYRDVWGCDVIGMTNMPEAKLAREAELCYASVAMVTDYDSWRRRDNGDGDEIDIAEILRVLSGNADKARALVETVAPALASHVGACRCGCDRALEFGLMTRPDLRDPALLAKLDVVAGRVLKP